MTTAPNPERLDDIAADLQRLADAVDHDPAYVEYRAEQLAHTVARLAGGEYRPAYNGWTNRETWNTSLWINNDAGLYETARETVREAMSGSDWDSRGTYRDQPGANRRYQIRTAADALRDWYTETFDEAWIDNAPPSSGPLADAWTYALACVDWFAIADGLAEDVPTFGTQD